MQLSKVVFVGFQFAARIMQSDGSLKSPLFWLSGYDLYLEFTPKGTVYSHEGCASLYLGGIRDSVRMKVRFTINDKYIQTCVRSCYPTLREEKCFFSWPARKAILDSIEYDSIFVKIEVLEVGQMLTDV